MERGAAGGGHWNDLAGAPVAPSTNRGRALFSRPTRLALLAIVTLALIPSLALNQFGSGIGLVDLRAWWHHKAGDDSWTPIALALDHMDHDIPSTLYEDTYYHSSEQFVYSPMSLLLFRWTQPLPGLNWYDRDSLNRIGWWMVLVLAAATALVFVWRARPDAPTAPAGKADVAVRIGLAFVATFLFYPAIKGYGLGNMQTWLNAAYVIALVAWLWRKPFATGLVLGIATVVKPQMSLFLLWALLRRQGRLALGMLVAVVPMAIVSLRHFGWPIHREYLDLVGVLSRRGESYQASQCVNGLLNRALFLGPNLKWDGGHTLLPYDARVHVATIVTSLILIGLALLWHRRDTARRDPLDFTGAMLTFTMAAPVAFEHHYGFLVPVFWLVFVRILEGPASSRRGWLAALGVAYFLSANYLWPVRHFAHTHLNFVQSYLFFGALLLLFLIYRLRETEPLVAEEPAAEAPANIG